ncbi:hypothetical protein FHX74_003157 [Friedmanniella endophytica]|uniref:Uncharacterized protein n=1 Tax=Microlunatus kandeliicorticis TaxID=1759536 RepID=A0A7W3IUJ4_9ACTN|nr:hypothetical protein [Microlunatus kandeliicorticis]MBA8795521.1 hypothetical protein [Microlunatus kandeliicorticis]
MKWVKRIVLVLVVTFALFYLITQPENAANAVRGAGEAIAGAFNSIMKFFSALAA